MSETENIYSYKVNVFDIENRKKIAHISPATKDEIINLNRKIWCCKWLNFWEYADWDCEGIVKLTLENNILGLIHFALYPYPFLNNKPEYLEILHIECLTGDKRLVNPVGFWLIWYVCQIAINNCQGDNKEGIILLDALEQAIGYYRDKVMMESIGWKTIAPGEEGYAFRFTQKSAKKFCTRIQRKYGTSENIE
jgi:hypothetical protein